MADRRLGRKVPFSVAPAINRSAGKIELELRSSIRHAKERGKLARQKLLRSGLEKSKAIFGHWNKDEPTADVEKKEFLEEERRMIRDLLSRLNPEQLVLDGSASDNFSIQIPEDIDPDFCRMYMKVKAGVPSGQTRLNEADFAICLMLLGSPN